jgi:type IV fimbrial biogenesis protein FimT
MVTPMNLVALTRPAEAAPDLGSSAGFTLIELLTVITVVAVLFAIGMPSYRYVTNANRISGEVNALLGDMQYARSEAIKEGQTVTVCSSTNATTCSNQTSWRNGWIVFTDVNGNGAVDALNDTILRVQPAFPPGDTFNANQGAKWVSFNREGFALGLNNTVTITLHAVVPDVGSTRCLAITIVGQLATQTSGQQACL